MSEPVPVRREERRPAVRQRPEQYWMEAKFDDGVLTVRIPRAEQSKPRRIKID